MHKHFVIPEHLKTVLEKREGYIVPKSKNNNKFSVLINSIERRGDSIRMFIFKMDYFDDQMVNLSKLEWEKSVRAFPNFVLYRKTTKSDWTEIYFEEFV